MDDPLDSGRELRKAVAQGFSTPADSPSIFVRAFQYFLVPCLIVAACVGVYGLATWIVFEKQSIRDLVIELKNSGGKARSNVAIQLATELRAAQQSGEPIPSDVVPALADVLLNTRSDTEEGSTIRYYVAICLGNTGDPAATVPLLKVLNEETNEETMTACLDALGAIGDPSSGPDVLPYLDHRSPLIRKYAVFNLAAIAKKTTMDAAPRWPEAVPAIRRKLDDSSVDVRWNAAFGLAYFLTDDTGLAVLHGMLDRGHVEQAIGKDPKKTDLTRHTMKMACAALWTLKDKTAVDLLNRVGRDDPDYEVRKAALDAAREIAKG